jgi:hypothetical protein
MSTEGHSTPSEGMECMACMEEIDTEGYVEYKTAEGEWKREKLAYIELHYLTMLTIALTILLLLYRTLDAKFVLRDVR